MAKDEKPQAAGSDFRLLSSQRRRIRNVTLIDETQNLMLTESLVVILLEFLLMCLTKIIIQGGMRMRDRYRN